MITPALRPAPSNPSILARVTTVLFLLEAGFSLAMPVILGWLLYKFLHRAEDAGPPLFMHWLMVLYPVMGWLWWIRVLVSVAAFFTLIAWVYVTFRNLGQRGARTRYQPGWALGGFFVPLWNFVWPYLAVREAWRAAAGLSPQVGAGGSAQRPTPLVVKLWWAMVMITVVIGTVGAKAVMPERMELSAILVAWYVCAAASSLLAIAVIAAVERELLNYPATHPLGLLGPWPLPATVSAGAVLATLLVVMGAYGLAMMGMRQLASEASVGIDVLPPDVIPPGALPPRPPESWHVQVEFAGQSVRVSWVGSGADLAGYNVYRRDAEGAPAKVNAELLRSPEFDDPSVEAGHTYLFSVSGVDRGGNESPHSLEASVTMPPGGATSSGAPGMQYISPSQIPGEAVGGVPGGVPGGVLGGIIGGKQAPPSPPSSKSQRIRLSGSVLENNLIHRVPPTYPPLAKLARVTGTVVLQVTVSKDGRVQDLRAISGHPLLVQSAMDAVRQWRYRPSLLNGEPVEVVSEVTVAFRLAD